MESQRVNSKLIWSPSGLSPSLKRIYNIFDAKVKEEQKPFAEHISTSIVLRHHG